MSKTHLTTTPPSQSGTGPALSGLVKRTASRKFCKLLIILNTLLSLLLPTRLIWVLPVFLSAILWNIPPLLIAPTTSKVWAPCSPPWGKAVQPCLVCSSHPPFWSPFWSVLYISRRTVLLETHLWPHHPPVWNPPLLPRALRRKNKHPHDLSRLSFSVLLPLPPFSGLYSLQLVSVPQRALIPLQPRSQDLTPAGLPLPVTPASAWLTAPFSAVASSMETF